MTDPSAGRNAGESEKPSTKERGLGMRDKRQACLGVSKGESLACAWRQAAEHSAHVLTLQHHAEALQEAICFNAGTVARRAAIRPASGARQTEPLGTNAAGFGRKRRELEAFRFAVLLCLEVTAPACLVGLRRGHA